MKVGKIYTRDYGYRYPHRQDYQPAYIEITPPAEADENGKGSIAVSFDGEIGNGVPVKVFHQRQLRFYFDASACMWDVRRAVKKIIPLAEKLVYGYDTRWDGSNLKGVWDAELVDEISELIDQELELE